MLNCWPLFPYYILPLLGPVQLVALTASPAGELTVEATEIKMQELLSRLDADLAAPVKTEDEVCFVSRSVGLCAFLWACICMHCG